MSDILELNPNTKIRLELFLKANRTDLDSFVTYCLDRTKYSDRGCLEDYLKSEHYKKGGVLRNACFRCPDD